MHSKRAWARVLGVEHDVVIEGVGFGGVSAVVFGAASSAVIAFGVTAFGDPRLL